MTETTIGGEERSMNLCVIYLYSQRGMFTDKYRMALKALLTKAYFVLLFHRT